ncbi:MAG TPA: hypothetical protein VFB99_10420 [Vicinamibacterales bacterium]|nr:hypothetical protein [Vicinamibacterales bacterium]
MKSPIEKWRLGYDQVTASGKTEWNVQVQGGDPDEPRHFDELVISAAGIHLEVMHDGTEPDDEGWACIDVHIGALHLYVNVHEDGRRRIIKNDGTFVDGMLMEET